MTAVEVAASSVRMADTPILLVEDDHGDAVLVQACLAEAGVADAAITWARTLADARVALSGAPACVLLDLGLPDAVGFSGVEAMVAAAPTTAVIVLTGRQERDGLGALSAGAQDYLVKDAITGELLERSIRYAIERKRAQEAQQQLREYALTAGEQARLERGLLPVPLLRTDAVACTTFYRPGNNAVLGGDFYDVIEGAGGRVRAVIGDVMGHGPDEAAIGVHLRVAWRTLVLAGTPDEQLLPNLALLLEAESDKAARFVTVCSVTIGSDGMTVRTAGHPAPLLNAHGRTDYLEVRVGQPLGLTRTPDSSFWPATTVPVDSGTTVVLYSDGLLDAHFDAAGDGIGVPGLVAAVDRHLASGAPAEAWLPDLVGLAPRNSVDDKAVVVLTVGAQR
ncbi:PP2C family protein-serine/threonine phosphatase [uncultured Jatrophihabitans sp.]|uniref:PP2C family protein-serine/threonine phosphatase n=1 Tax=uncultured Jatrophihabitans sp. TaxID=1610747 RepID=UPI0035C96066